MGEPRWFPHVYDEVMAPLEARWLGAYRREIFEGLGGRILEVGFGTGINAALYPTGADVTAIDLDEGMIARGLGRPGADRLVVLQMDVQNLAFADATFDVAVSTLLFCGVEDPRKGLSEILRVLKPGGRLVMLEHTVGPNPVVNAVLHGLSAIAVPLCGEHFDRDTARTVAEAGFADVTNRHLALGTFHRIEGRKPA